jgi:hypothetical protein
MLRSEEECRYRKERKRAAQATCTSTQNKLSTGAAKKMGTGTSWALVVSRCGALCGPEIKRSPTGQKKKKKSGCAGLRLGPASVEAAWARPAGQDAPHRPLAGTSMSVRSTEYLCCTQSEKVVGSIAC